MQKYIDAKDSFDFKNNNYTTTENVDTTPNEDVRNLQRKLNEAGYTDKFGQKLKEDGIYAGKTAYADDRYRIATVNGKAYQVEYPIATKESLQPRMLNDSEVKLASADYDAKLTSSKSGADYEKNSRKVQR